MIVEWVGTIRPWRSRATLHHCDMQRMSRYCVASIHPKHSVTSRNCTTLRCRNALLCMTTLCGDMTIAITEGTDWVSAYRTVAMGMDTPMDTTMYSPPWGPPPDRVPGETPGETPGGENFPGPARAPGRRREAPGRPKIGLLADSCYTAGFGQKWPFWAILGSN